jgi:hypothetical protein
MNTGQRWHGRRTTGGLVVTIAAANPDDARTRAMPMHLEAVVLQLRGRRAPRTVTVEPLDGDGARVTVDVAYDGIGVFRLYSIDLPPGDPALGVVLAILAPPPPAPLQLPNAAD